MIHHWTGETPKDLSYSRLNLQAQKNCHSCQQIGDCKFFEKADDNAFEIILAGGCPNYIQTEWSKVCTEEFVMRKIGR